MVVLAQMTATRWASMPASLWHPLLPCSVVPGTIPSFGLQYRY